MLAVITFSNTRTWTRWRSYGAGRRTVRGRSSSRGARHISFSLLPLAHRIIVHEVSPFGSSGVWWSVLGAGGALVEGEVFSSRRPPCGVCRTPRRCSRGRNTPDRLTARSCPAGAVIVGVAGWKTWVTGRSKGIHAVGTQEVGGDEFEVGMFRVCSHGLRRRTGRQPLDRLGKIRAQHGLIPFLPFSTEVESGEPGGSGRRVETVGRGRIPLHGGPEGRMGTTLLRSGYEPGGNHDSLASWGVWRWDAKATRPPWIQDARPGRVR